MKIKNMKRMRVRKAIVAVEFALILPILVLMFSGTVEVTQAVRAQSAFQRAVASTLNVVAVQTGVTSTKLADYCTGATLSIYPFITTSLSMSMTSVTNTSGTIARDWEYDAACPSQGVLLGSTGAISSASAMVPNSGDSVIMIQASYLYTPLFKSIIPFSFTMNKTGFARPRHGAIPCSSGC